MKNEIEKVMIDKSVRFRILNNYTKNFLPTPYIYEGEEFGDLNEKEKLEINKRFLQFLEIKDLWEIPENDEEFEKLHQFTLDEYIGWSRFLKVNTL